MALCRARHNAHARRKFVDVANVFPDEVKHVLVELGKVPGPQGHGRSAQQR
jgi:hypothetical protein